MQDLVSNRWLVASVSLASICVAGVLFASYGFAWAGVGLLGLGLTLPCALWVKVMAPSSMSQVLQEVEAERAPRAAGRVGPPLS
jgi:hypothetical protein